MNDIEYTPEGMYRWVAAADREIRRQDEVNVALWKEISDLRDRRGKDREEFIEIRTKIYLWSTFLGGLFGLTTGVIGSWISRHLP